MWSVDLHAMKYNARNSIQPGRQEIIEGLKEMVKVVSQRDSVQLIMPLTSPLQAWITKFLFYSEEISYKANILPG